MVKIDSAIASQSLQGYEKPKEKEAERELRSADTVSISAEGKRRHILGHVLANISEPVKRDKK
ncbi:MAG TPA: hypothetical protein DDW94_04185 [Deltaproteobacteria bacterium]|nr:MAG: hypothetical protein A2Z79_10595 [Deltaproteobacteria bacterium GWA2_55_82]OGQ62926.1 MAG: hypothetical protein A3I81_06375 [Deltaproteobacteria bacterium RIFCSPLOWO2_02_FULL_55_12]OIJ72888.1 MAG: hypothetical protein A2V21_300610 [Deltaproteobacteria bacterium GWC2_55_46]HBG46171.1 hypothetical protein [Deltaproteobacteria bacterium]HCY11669.1 hypothetical protein [Deltaproteobacteria bacterium]